MPFPFSVVPEGKDNAVSISLMLLDDGKAELWLESSRMRPARMLEHEWPAGLAESVDKRNSARDGARKGRTLILREGQSGDRKSLRPVAVLSWHVHEGNWPLCVLDCGYRLGLDASKGRRLVEGVLLPALGELNDHPKFVDRKVPRPTDELGWAVTYDYGAGQDQRWAKAVAARAQRDWGFSRVPPAKRPGWAKKGFYGTRPR